MAVVIVRAPAYGGLEGSAAEYLRTQVSPRMGAMSAGVALEADVFNNPAALHQRRQRSGGFGYRTGAGEFDYYSASYSQPLGQAGALGLGVRYFGIDHEERFDPDEDHYGGDFSHDGMAAALHYSSWVNLPGLAEPLSYSLGAKGIHDGIDDESASALAMDAGLHYSFSDMPLKAGLTLQNLGSDLEYIKKSESLPTNVRAGLAYKIDVVFLPPITIAGDAEYDVNDSYNRYDAGVELTPLVGFDLRAGYRTTSDEELDSNLTTGFGLQLNGLRLDYAYTPGDELENENSLFITTSF